VRKIIETKVLSGLEAKGVEQVLKSLRKQMFHVISTLGFLKLSF